MRLFGRKKDKTPETQEPPFSSWPEPMPQAPEPGEPETQTTELAPGVTFRPNGDITLKIRSVAEAKHGIKQLQLKKKEYSAEKRLLATKVSEQQDARRMQIANQGSKMRGGGKFR